MLPGTTGKCAQGDSNSHGPNGPQGPQPCGDGSARHDIYWSGSLSRGWLNEGERESAQVKPRELSSCRANGSFSFPLTFPRPPELALRLALRGEGEGLENRWPSQGGPRVRIPPPPLKHVSTGVAAVALYVSAVARCGLQRLVSSSICGRSAIRSSRLLLARIAALAVRPLRVLMAAERSKRGKRPPSFTPPPIPSRMESISVCEAIAAAAFCARRIGGSPRRRSVLADGMCSRRRRSPRPFPSRPLGHGR
jgi:hypothetical protein